MPWSVMQRKILYSSLVLIRLFKLLHVAITYRQDPRRGESVGYGIGVRPWEGGAPLAHRGSKPSVSRQANTSYCAFRTLTRMVLYVVDGATLISSSSVLHTRL